MLGPVVESEYSAQTGSGSFTNPVTGITMSLTSESTMRQRISRAKKTLTEARVVLLANVPQLNDAQLLEPVKFPFRDLTVTRFTYWQGPLYQIRNHHLTVGARIAGAIASRFGDGGLPEGRVRLRFTATAYCKGTTTASGVNVLA